MLLAPQDIHRKITMGGDKVDEPHAGIRTGAKVVALILTDEEENLGLLLLLREVKLPAGVGMGVGVLRLPVEGMLADEIVVVLRGR